MGLRERRNTELGLGRKTVALNLPSTELGMLGWHMRVDERQHRDRSKAGQHVRVSSSALTCL